MTQPLYTFEDFRPGDVAEYGGLVVDRDEMVEFAKEYDPQPMHVSEKAAHGSMLGELIGSGWYTTGLLMRMNCDAFLIDSTSMGAPGVDSVEWRQPVRAGDRLRVRREVISARRSLSRSDVGIVKFVFDVLNQHDAVVMRQVGSIMFGRRREAA
ncbi:MaoC family dehydratase [Methylopila sp. M107]|uniref:MaoC family dehydratase n=1 Tax=Methylopila sp. M107 TaxID=1101190 RepID=UPI00037FD916|nr:MaoC family dehydratase [Methylopila sp. M107]